LNVAFFASGRGFFVVLYVEKGGTKKKSERKTGMRFCEKGIKYEETEF